MKLARPLAITAAVIALLTAALFAYTVLRSDGSPATRPIVTAQAERRTLRESIVAKGSVQYPSTGTLLAAAAGRVTAVNVSPGDTITAGQAILSIDGRPAIAVPGDLPFWRDLTFGATGPDVLQLKEALAAEGYDPGPIDSNFNGATGVALGRWQAAHGFPADATFRPTDAFAGAWPARVGHVRVTRGQFVAPGGELLSLTSDTLEITLQFSPSQRLRVSEGLHVAVELTGTRTVVTGSLGPIVPVPAPGNAGQDQPPSYVATVVVDPNSFRAVDGAPVTGTIVLAEAHDAVAVPVAAIVMDGDGDTAVQVRQPSGNVQLIPVTTGLSEGAFVQVTSGLGGGERVLLEQPKK